jgi:hypothetical protein
LPRSSDFVQPPTRGVPDSVREARMNSQFLKDHLIDFEVIAALGIGALLRYGFDTSWPLRNFVGLVCFHLNTAFDFTCGPREGDHHDEIGLERFPSKVNGF